MYFFFLSSRRRHTRCLSDWSSDVCSSDLETATHTGRFVRCSSEFPFLPGPQRVVRAIRSGKLGRIMEIRSGFWHSSDLDQIGRASCREKVTLSAMMDSLE